MKENWPRQVPVVALDAASIARLLLPLFPGKALQNFELVGGGLSNTNYKVMLEGHAGALLLRLYQRGAASGEKEQAIEHLVARRVPVLHMLYFAETNPVTGHPYAILDWAEGADLQHLRVGLPRGRLLALAPRIGGTLAAIHSFTFAMFGFFDSRLNVKGPIDLDKSGLRAYLDERLVRGPGGGRLGPELTGALIAYVEKHGDLLADWLQQPCLVHGDFNAANILVRTEMTGDRIGAIIDWEYALSASPALDFGNLLRPPFDKDEAFAAALAKAYVAAGGFLPREWQRIARLADVFSFADILGRPQAADVVIRDARSVIETLVAK